MKLLNKCLLSLTAVTAFSAHAQTQTVTEDLKLDGARWLAKSTGFVCAADATTKIATPADLKALSVEFVSAVTDFTLDNALVLATFSPEAGTTCSYSVQLFADNSLKTIELVDSRAFAKVGTASCSAGKAILDAALTAPKYTWKERGHILTILAPNASATELCGAGNESVGIQFTLAGKIN